MKKTMESIDNMLREIEIRAYETALAVCNGQIKRAAQALGIERTTLTMRLKKYKIDAEDYRDYIEPTEPVELPVQHEAFRLPGMGSLKQYLLVRVYDELKAQNGKRRATSRELGISTRSLTNYIHELERLGFQIPAAWQ